MKIGTWEEDRSTGTRWNTPPTSTLRMSNPGGLSDLAGPQMVHQKELRVQEREAAGFNDGRNHPRKAPHDLANFGRKIREKSFHRDLAQETDNVSDELCKSLRQAKALNQGTQEPR